MSLSSSFVLGGDGLLGLHEALRADRFVVGPGELLAATRLLVRLQETGQLPADAAALANRLRAVYCKSPAEQKRFSTTFEKWLATRKPEQVFQREAQTAAEVAPATTAPARQARWPRVVMTIAIGALIAFLVWQRLAPDTSSDLGPVAPAPPIDTTGSSTTSATTSAPPKQAAAPVIDPREADAGVTGYVPVQRAQREFRPWVVLLLLALPLPLLVLLYAPALVLSRRHGERSRQGGRVSLDVSDWRMEAERVVPALDLRTAARLDRHVRPGFDAPTLASRRVLDTPRTLAATLRRHALTLRWRPRRARPSYLVLIDVHDEHDMRGRLFFRWADRLRREGVAVDLWLFDRDPRTLYPPDRRRVLDSDGRERNAVRFEHAASRATADLAHRLIVVSDGAGFFAEGHQLRDWWPTLGWARWKQRVMFTSLDSRDWGKREVAIERPLARGDPGFLVLPLEQEALDAYAVYLTKGVLPPILLTSTRYFPPLIERLPQRGLSSESPLPAEIESLIEQLRLYLGDNGLRWFAACAIPPLTRWELTLLIGQALFRELGADSEDSLRWLMSTNYPRLARLPWLREANIPDWLALRLLHELSPAMQDRVREVVRKLLRSVPTADDIAAGDVLALDCAPPASGGAAPPVTATDTTETAEEKDKRERKQWLYLGFLDGLSPRQLAMRAPAKWRNFFAGDGALAARGVGMRRLGQMMVDWIRALAARLMWRDGLAGSGAAGRPLWLAGGWFAAVAAGLLMLAAHPVDRLPPALDNALFVERDIGVGDISELPFRSLGFSGDGKRFVVGEASGEVRVKRADADGKTPRAVGPLIRVAGSLANAHLNSSGNEVVTVTRNGVVTRWNSDTGTNKGQSLPVDGNAPVIASAMDPTAKFVVMQRDGGAIEVRSVDEIGSTTKGLRIGGEDTLRSVRPAPDGSPAQIAVAITDLDGFAVALSGATVMVHDPSRGAGYLTALPADGAERGWLSADGSQAAVSSDRGRLLLVFDLEPLMILPPNSGVTQRLFPWLPVLAIRLESPLTRVALARDSKRIAVAIESGEVRVWEIGRAVPLLGVIPANGNSIRDLHLSPRGKALLVQDGRELAAYNLDRPVANASPTATRAQGATSMTFAPLGSPLAHGAPVAAVAFAPNGDRLLTATAEHEVLLWEGAQLRSEARVQPLPASPQRVVAVAAGGQRAASAGADGRITVWSPLRDAIEASFKHPENAGAVAALALTADGALLASGGRDGSLRLWDLRQRQALGEASHGTELSALHFDAEGQFIVSVGAGSARLWRVGESGPQAGPALNARNVVTARFSPDGESVLTATRDGLVQRWAVGTGQLIAGLRIDDGDPTAAGVQRQLPAARARTSMLPLRSLQLASTERMPAASLFDGIQFAQTEPSTRQSIQAQRNVQSVAAPKWLDTLVGMPLERARALIGQEGFTIGNVKYAPSKANDGTVQRVVPTGLRSVDLVVAGDGERILVPNVTRIQLDQARTMLRESGLVIGSVRSASSRLPDGTVMSMTPPAGAYVPPNSRVSLVVSGTPLEATPNQAPVSGSAGVTLPAGARCRSGFVSRDAFAGDSVCVAQSVHAQVQQDNTQARERVDPINRAFGAETCRSGFVWREADRYLRGDRFTDKVCVVPEQRAQAVADNAERTARVDTGAELAGQASGQAAGQASEQANLSLETILQDAHFEDADGALLLVVSSQRARLLDTSTLQPVGPAITHAGITQARFLPASGLVATASTDGQVRLWLPVTGEELGLPLLHGAPVVALETARNSRFLATLDLRGRMRVWDVQARLPLPQDRPSPAAADRATTAVSGRSEADAGAGLSLRTTADRMNALFALGPTATVAMAFDADGARIVTAGNDGAARSATLPSSLPGILRVVRPYALGWLVLLLLLIAGSIAASAGLFRVRKRRTAALVRDVGPSAAPSETAAPSPPAPLAETA